MATTFDQDNTIYDALNGSPVKASISGGIYKLRRPDDSEKEDIVIGSLPITGMSVQIGTTIVNIHVPDIVVNVNGVQQAQPDTARLKELTDMATTAIREAYGPDYAYWMEEQGVVPDDTGDNHFASIKLQFRYYNF